jgi:hypothetical protein
MILRNVLVSVVVALPICLGWGPVDPRLAHGSGPSEVEVGGHHLILNGSGLYQATVLKVDVFLVSLYVDHPTHDAAEVSRCDVPLVVDFTWLRGIGKSRLADGWRETMRTNAGADLEPLAARIDALTGALPGVSEGDRWRFVYDPAQGLTLSIDGARAVTVPGRDFCRLFVDGQLGPHADADVRRSLLGLGE